MEGAPVQGGGFAGEGALRSRAARGRTRAPGARATMTAVQDAQGYFTFEYRQTLKLRR
jgi:hypothetical protein